MSGSEIRLIDGSHGEGGGQVLRTALTLSVLTGQSTRIEHIRAGRKKSGLRPQHLTAVRAAAAICDAELAGDALDSQTILFAPGKPAQAGAYTFDVRDASKGGSAGSVGLVLQTILLPLSLTGDASHITLRGGTHVPWAPSAFYLAHTFLPTLKRMGIETELDVSAWGFYPAGGGEIRVTIQGREGPLNPLRMIERGELTRIWGQAVATNLPAHIPQRMANRAQNVLAETGLAAQIKARRLGGAGPGTGIFTCAEYAAVETGEPIVAGFTAYGRKGLPAERVAETVCEALLTHHHTAAPVDPHLADQLILPMALAGSAAGAPSTIYTSRVSEHLLTNIWVIQQFMERDIETTGDIGAPGVVTIQQRNAT